MTLPNRTSVELVGSSLKHRVLNKSSNALGLERRDIDVTIDHPHSDRLRVAAGIVLVNVDSVADPKSPVVNATANDSVFQVASGQRSARVRAAIVERVDLVTDAEQANGAAIDDKHSPLSGVKFVEEADPLEFVHATPAFRF
jgi:hypothetical protein